MPTTLQLRRGTTAQNNSYTGAVGEITVDTDLDTIRVHDGSAAGGFELLQKNATQNISNKTLDINIKETFTSSATAATGTINFDNSSYQVLYYTSNSSANFTVNIRGNASVTLNSLLAIGESLSCIFMVTNGGTAYYQTGFQIDGNAVTPKWQGGTAPSSGNTNSIDIYNYTIMKTANATFTVLASQTKFA
jgi:hypothetical protein